jgi:hypothetical protein
MILRFSGQFVTVTGNRRMPSGWLAVFGGEMVKFIINLGINDWDFKSSKNSIK